MRADGYTNINGDIDVYDYGGVYVIDTFGGVLSLTSVGYSNATWKVGTNLNDMAGNNLLLMGGKGGWRKTPGRPA